VIERKAMRIGIVLPTGASELPQEGLAYPFVKEVALVAEGAGLDSVWVYDHLLFRSDGKTDGLLECWTVLAAIADATKRVELGTIVMCTSFRNPALLAKMAATLDDVSGGRLILGIGCGWHDPEYEAFGYPTDHKVSRFEESLAVITGLIRDGRADLDGKYVTARDAVLIPPARRDLPILIASKGPRMLELTARHANAWNLAWFGFPDERLTRVRGELMDTCARVGRDPSTLSITVGVTVRYPDDATAGEADGGDPPKGLVGTPDEIAAGLAAHAAAGANHVIASLDPCTPATVALFAEAVTLFRAGAPA
jgi:alkanesulfonate monooxygenase SsuD/methylene tetrahydromethanopterin reductase-like flavin-dependent oxidoreductase (luciferase family)